MGHWRYSVLLLLALGVPAGVLAKPWWMRGVESNESDFLPPDIAFRVAARVEGDRLSIRWAIADGYYLYRQKMTVTAESPDLVVSPPSFPPGILRTDPYLGTQEIFVSLVEGTAAFSRIDGGAHPLEIKVVYQGCAEAGLCYPPITKVLFPVSSATVGTTQPHAWEGVAIIGGVFAFLWAGFVLQKQRRLDMPAA